jgi:hypothetical protein
VISGVGELAGEAEVTWFIAMTRPALTAKVPTTARDLVIPNGREIILLPLSFQFCETVCFAEANIKLNCQRMVRPDTDS